MYSSTPILDFIETASYSDSDLSEQDPAQNVFGYFFSSGDSLKNKNKYLFQFLQLKINDKNFDFVERFLRDPAWSDLHPSLLNSAILVTDNIADVLGAREILKLLLDNKSKFYS